jgi:hypothetical protein
MLTRQKKWLLVLFRELNELRAAPLMNRLLALKIQEQLLDRIGRAERLIRQIRHENKSIKKALALRGSDRNAAQRQKLVILQEKSG